MLLMLPLLMLRSRWMGVQAPMPNMPNMQQGFSANMPNMPNRPNQQQFPNMQQNFPNMQATPVPAAAPLAIPSQELIARLAAQISQQAAKLNPEAAAEAAALGKAEKEAEAAEKEKAEKEKEKEKEAEGQRRSRSRSPRRRYATEIVVEWATGGHQQLWVYWEAVYRRSSRHPAHLIVGVALEKSGDVRWR